MRKGLTVSNVLVFFLILGINYEIRQCYLCLALNPLYWQTAVQLKHAYSFCRKILGILISLFSKNEDTIRFTEGNLFYFAENLLQGRPHSISQSVTSIHLILILHVAGVEQLFTLYIVEHVTLFRFKNTFLHLQLPSCFLGRSIILLFPSTAQLHLALQNRGKINRSIQFFFPNTNLKREIMLHN